MKFSFEQVRMAFEHANGGRPGENTALIRGDLGRIMYSANYGSISDVVEADRSAPDAVDLPRKEDLGLGSKLAFDFVRAFLPGHIDKAAEIFEERGAFRRFKGWLKGKALHLEWFRFEAEASEKALRRWCAENGIELED